MFELFDNDLIRFQERILVFYRIGTKFPIRGQKHPYACIEKVVIRIMTTPMNIECKSLIRFYFLSFDFLMKFPKKKNLSVSYEWLFLRTGKSPLLYSILLILQFFYKKKHFFYHF